nr:PREDICTED: uncharacterized protein LOC104150792 [Struthio camelus australis]
MREGAPLPAVVVAVTALTPHGLLGTGISNAHSEFGVRKKSICGLEKGKERSTWESTLPTNAVAARAPGRQPATSHSPPDGANSQWTTVPFALCFLLFVLSPSLKRCPTSAAAVGGSSDPKAEVPSSKPVSNVDERAAPLQPPPCPRHYSGWDADAVRRRKFPVITWAAINFIQPQECACERTANLLRQTRISRYRRHEQAWRFEIARNGDKTVQKASCPGGKRPGTGRRRARKINGGGAARELYQLEAKAHDLTGTAEVIQKRKYMYGGDQSYFVTTDSP